MDFGSLLKMASSVLQSSNSGDSNHDSAMSQIGGLIQSLCDDHSAQNGQTATLGGGNESTLPQLLGSIGQALLGGGAGANTGTAQPVGGEAGSIFGNLFSGMSKGAAQGGSVQDLLRGVMEQIQGQPQTQGQAPQAQATGDSGGGLGGLLGMLMPAMQQSQTEAHATDHSSGLRAAADALEQNMKTTRAKRGAAHPSDAHADSLSAFMQALASAGGK